MPHEFETVYVIVDVPVAIPKSVPVAEPIVATDVFELLQVPPDTVVEKVAVLPVQILVTPDIAPALDAGLTVSVLVVKQPPESV